MCSATVNDISGLNPINVKKIIKPTNIDEIVSAIKDYQGAISIGGGYFSMGGQVATENSLHIDMRSLNNILEFNLNERYICVQAGIRWCDIQSFIDKHQLSIKVMQTYANFTVGGSLSVNVHGRYIGQGSLLASVKSFKIILADGEVIHASRTAHKDIFFGAIGGYGGLGVIVEVTLELVPNTKVEQQQIKLNVVDYLQYFSTHIQNNHKAVFHNADLYPPYYNHVRAITWLETDKSNTTRYQLLESKNFSAGTTAKFYPIMRYLIWATAFTPFGKWRRQYIFDPFFYIRKRVVWRNTEASRYDVAELEPKSRKFNTYVLQEYFIPINRFYDFLPKITDILQRYKVNILNISIRHAVKDNDALLSWARNEVFAFVLYYQQGTSPLAMNKVATWTRELIDAAILVDGSYYLPYQIHATMAQFHKAYPRALEFFALKNRVDPQYKFRNKLWDKYYQPTLSNVAIEPEINIYSEFQAIFFNADWRNKFYIFLQNIYHLHPENEFHLLIWQACQLLKTDTDIYNYIQQSLPSIKPLLANIRYALPALFKQKNEMAKQTAMLLKNNNIINGYLEIGTRGRYLKRLKKYFSINQPIYIANDTKPSYALTDIFEREQFKKIGHFISLRDYEPFAKQIIKNESLDMVSCFIGLHHAPLNKLDQFVDSIHRILRPGGTFLFRDHDVACPQMKNFVSLAHTVFNLGLGVSCETNYQEIRNFKSISDWIAYLETRGFRDSGERLLQEHDPSANTLLKFIKL